MRHAASLLLLFVLTAAAAPAGEPARENLPGADFKPGRLKLPLVVTERCGVERKGAVVTGGVPFPPGFLSDVKKLRVVDAAGKPVPSQAQLMIKWHKPAYDDSVQWALVSFPADVAAKGTATYYLVDDGKTAVPATALKVTETGDAITVQTGPAKFLVPKKGAALVSEALFGKEKVIGGKGLRGVVKSGNWADHGLEAGMELVGEAGSVAIEESGPARVVVRVKGTFKPGDKEKKYYDFTARMYFAAGSPAVRIIYTISNGRLRPELIAGKRRAYVWPIEDASLVAELAHGGDAARTLAEGKKINSLVADKRFLVHQDSSGGDKWKDLPGGNYERWLVRYTKGKLVKGVTFRGYKVTLGADELAKGNAHLGVVDSSGAKAGVAAALRNFRVRYPGALSVTKKELRVGLFPGEFAEPFHLNSGQRRSWDVKLVLHGAAAGPDLSNLHAAHDGIFLFRVQPAWMVRAACSGAWPSGLALASGGRKGAPRRDKSKLDGIHAGWDWYGWISGWNSGGGHWNQSTCFANWVLYGNGAEFDASESRAIWASDTCALHYDDPEMKTFWLMLRSWNWRENRLAGETYPKYYNRDTWGLPDSGHMAMFMWLEYYLLTGDMRAREAMEHLGVRARAFLWKYNHDDRNDGTGPLSRGIGWCKKLDPDKDPGFKLYNRYIGWPLYDLSLYYRLTGRPELIREARTVARAFRNTGRWSPTGFLCCYVNKKGDRGMYGGQGPFAEYRDKSASQCYAHFQMGIMVTGLVEYYRMSRDVEALDTMIGFSDFMTHHAMLRDDGGKRRGWTYAFGDYWGPYTWKDLGPKPRTTFMVSNFRVIQPMGAVYGYTGRKDYMEVLSDAIGTLRRPNFGVIAAHMAVSHPKADAEPPAAVKDLKAEALGGGKVKLSWTAPAGDAAWYQVKSSGSPIVERVKGWPDRSEPQPADKAEWEAKVKAFQAKQLAFWQALNLPGAPVPGNAGDKQEMTVSGLAAGKTHFALKSWDANENMSALSNVVEVEVK